MWSLSKNNKYCILRNKLTKKYVDHSEFCVDNAHIYMERERERERERDK